MPSMWVVGAVALQCCTCCCWHRHCCRHHTDAVRGLARSTAALYCGAANNHAVRHAQGLMPAAAKATRIPAQGPAQCCCLLQAPASGVAVQLMSKDGEYIWCFHLLACTAVLGLPGRAPLAGVGCAPDRPAPAQCQPLAGMLLPAAIDLGAETPPVLGARHSRTCLTCCLPVLLQVTSIQKTYQLPA